MSRYDSFKAEKVVDETALREFKNKYDENIIQTAEDVIASASNPIPNTDIVGTKALYQMLGGITFGQDDNGRYGYRIGTSSEITPFGVSGYNGFGGLIYTTGYENSNGQFGVFGQVIMNNRPDVIEREDYTIESSSQTNTYLGIKITEECDATITYASNKGIGSSSDLDWKFEILDWKNNFATLESNVSLNNVRRSFEGKELIVSRGRLNPAGSPTTDEQRAYFGSLIFDIQTIASDFVYKPIIMNNLYVKGDGFGSSFHKDSDTKYDSVLISGLDDSSTGFFIGNGGTSGGSYGTSINNIGFERGTLGTVVNGSEAKIHATFNNSEATATCGITFKLPNTFLEGKTPKCIANVGGFISNHFGSNPKYSTHSWTVEGIPEGHNGFVVRTGDGSTYVNGIELKSNRSAIVKNGDVVITYLGAGPSSHCTGYAFVLQV